MTAEEIVIAALARGGEFGQDFPSTRSVYYRRIAARNRSLLQKLGSWNAALTGVDEVVDVIDNTIPLTGLSVTPGEIRHLAVETPGTSGYAQDETISIISPADVPGHLPPRVYWRGAETLVGVREYGVNDLAGVTAVRVFATDSGFDELGEDDSPSIPALFHELLVIDLTRFMATKMVSTPAPTGAAPLLGVLAEEEAGLLADFERYALSYGDGNTSRFRRDERPTLSRESTR